MSDKFKGIYEIDDGYVGKAAPQYFNIDSSDIDEFMEVDELAEIFEDAMQADFEQTIFPCAENKEAFIEWGLEIIEALKEGGDHE